ncbi:MAG TPA: hypothetical protein ENI42_00240 [Thermoplasmatales archaeon]|nr:hypothetical protein [Thermoplasmatales archaeon]
MRKSDVVYLITATIILSTMVFSGCLNNETTNAWTLKITQVDKLQNLGLDGTGVTVGIVDTGVYVQHNEFDKTTFIVWRDYVNNAKKPYDDNGHGTHIAGILFSKGSWSGSISGYHLKGLCPGAKAVIVKAVSETGETKDEDIAAAIDFCVAQGADIILLSLTKNPETIPAGERTRQSCEDALKKGVFIVAPAGDDGETDDGEVNVLAGLPEVIAVGSIQKNGYISPFSSRGNQAWMPGLHPERVDPNKKPELIAPGENIISTSLNGGYLSSSGTSQAAAYVAGILALLLQAYPQYKHGNNSLENINKIKETLAETAYKTGGVDIYTGTPLTHNDRYGYGVIQAYDAYVKLSR